ncbi:hypothetical protein ABPG75_004917 [Micractinium tetrahymenae]
MAGPACLRQGSTPAASLLLGGLAVALLVLLALRSIHGGVKGSAALHSPRQLAAAVEGLAPAAADGGAAAEIAAVEALLDGWPLGKPRACIVILARNSDLDGVLSSVLQLERRFNSHTDTKYPYLYLNDRPFSPEFKRAVAAATAAPSFFGLVPREHWSYPPHINQTRAAQLRSEARRHMPYGGSESYRFMCRYFSGFFFDHPLLAGFDFYWRVEPDVHFTCNLERDPFRVMQRRNASLAWTIVMSEVPSTIPSLWPTTQQWLAANPQHLAPRSLLPAFLEGQDDAAAGWGPFSLVHRWRTEQQPGVSSGGGGGGDAAGGQPWRQRQYTGCHFWSNFEIGRLSFFRSAAYRSFFAHLDAAGGFFYERWGDAPVHTLAAAALLDRSRVLWASDIGYKHGSWAHCPLDPASRPRCDCSPFYDAQPGRQPSCQLDFLDRLAALEAAEAATSQ